LLALAAAQLPSQQCARVYLGVLVLCALATGDHLACARGKLQSTARRGSFGVKQRCYTSLKMEIRFLVLPHASGDVWNKVLLSQLSKNHGIINFHYFSTSLPRFFPHMFFWGIQTISALHRLKKNVCFTCAK